MNHPGYLIWEGVLRTRQRHASPEGALQEHVRTAVLQREEIAVLEECLQVHASLGQHYSIISDGFTILKRESQGPAKILQYYDDYV